MARTQQLWSKFFNLRCKSLDEFPKFNSGLKTVTSLLHEVKSVAVTDNTFIKVFLSSSMDCEDLANEAKKFLTESDLTYDQIMDQINMDYRAQIGGELLRTDVLSSSKQLRRMRSGDVTSTNRKSSPTTTVPKVRDLTKLPPNTGNLIPNAYYKQFREWYEASRVQESDRSNEQRNFLTHFKWKHTADPKTKRAWVAPTRQNDNRRRNNDDRRSRRARGRTKRNRSPSSDSYSDDSAPRSRHTSRRARRRESSSRSRNRSRSRSPVERRDRDNEVSKSKSASSRRASLFTRK